MTKAVKRKVVELTSFDGPHSPKFSAKKLETLALSQWRKAIRESYTSGTKRSKTTYYPQITIESRVNHLEETIVKLAERITGIMETMLVRLGKLEEKLDDLDFRTSI